MAPAGAADEIRHVSPVARVLFYASLAALAAGLGALPFARRVAIPAAWLGWANAVAAGLMLGAAWLLVDVGMRLGALPAAGGAILGVGFLFWTHAVSQTSEVELNRTEDDRAGYGTTVVFRSALHSAAEGVAIGASMVVRLELGVFMAIAMAVHNVPEGMVLAAVLRGRGVNAPNAAVRAVAVNGGQVVLAVAAFAATTVASATLPWTLGFAAGALVYLVLVELLPESYHQAGRTSIAVLTSLAIGAVVLLEALTGR